ncbi:tetratricopeptide repeat protein [Ideonella sp. 4Y16]|uniref:tetratricopeptide repeat protein n=1 Tax=Ideonella alba TaxID=2824118 RepID=UPI001B370F61|nr:tetratricopeptide repeat protein [Ideonella alba]MBQ0945690.1 tetratricopeptide repeat protein [Ideonella alba]
MADNTPARPMPEGWDQPAERLWRAGQRMPAIQAAVASINGFGERKPAPRVLQLAYYLFLIGDYGGAATVLEQLLRQQPEHQEALINLAVCLQRLGRHGEVLSLSERVLALQPDLPLALDLRAKSLMRVGRRAEAQEAGRLSLETKDRALPEPGSPWQPPPHPLAQQVQGKASVVSFSLWGANPRYLRGALRNALLMPDLYPGWVMRLSLDESVPQAFVDALRALRVDVRVMPSGQSLRQRLCWRFLVANDPAVGRFVVRDCDSVFSLREVRAVDDWIASGRWFHVIRDWWTHTDLMLAGLWGGVAGVLPDLGPLLTAYQSRQAETPNVDQWFLRDCVWPLVRRHVLVHDRLFAVEGRVTLPDPQGNFHIGQDEFSAHRERQQRLLSAWIERLPCLRLPDDVPVEAMKR